MIHLSQVRLRPVTDADEPLLLEIYTSARAPELAMVPWTPEQKTAFVKMQFEAQTRHYSAEHPQATHDIICMGDVPVGRIYLDRGPQKFHILDITILPQHRNAGIGTHVLRQIMEEASQVGKPVTIYVEVFNPSTKLFQRLGFRQAAQQEIHLLFEFKPNAVPKS